VTVVTAWVLHLSVRKTVTSVLFGYSEKIWRGKNFTVWRHYYKQQASMFRMTRKSGYHSNSEL